MSEKTLHLICNSHIDPVWLWEWEEGLAETLSTFRTAAKFCDEFDGFIFCHNEALLYQWVEEHEPDLFSKIQQLVNENKWHIMGGWYVQPDCNIPSGESFVRQILRGKLYFREKFNKEPKTAINLDPFGHTRGLVQILAKSGYLGYLFCRPDHTLLKLPDHDFIWKGYDGSELLAHRAPDHYNSEKGKIGEKITKWLGDSLDRESGILLWGIGNHGGGPSREDLERIADLQQRISVIDIQHSTPDKYFTDLKDKCKNLPKREGDLNPFAVGCYTSMSKVKQKHRQLENSLFFTEKILTHAVMNNLMSYPSLVLQEALDDLLFCSFHDILPGSAIAEVETDAVSRLEHGLQIISRLRAKAFFKLLSGQRPASDGEFPIHIYNPHPHLLREIVQLEFQPPEPNFNPDQYWQVELRNEQGNKIPCQIEKESCSIDNDQRKRIVFKADLEPSSMTRYSCFIKEVRISKKPVLKQKEKLIFKTGSAVIEINRQTGLIDRYSVNGNELVASSACRLLVMKDDADPWGMRVDSFINLEGKFSLMTPKRCAEFAGVDQTELNPIRIIEDGPVRTIVEALFNYKQSTACLRYKIPREGTEIEIEARIYWQEKDRMLKFSVPTSMGAGKVRGQTAYGVESFPQRKKELIAQKWIEIHYPKNQNTLSIVNDRSYGFDVKNGDLRLSILRSPAYAGHPVDGRALIVNQDRFTPRMEQGERIFKFWINGGQAAERTHEIDKEAQVKAEFPFPLCCFPTGEGSKIEPAVILSNDIIRLTAFKIAEMDGRLIIRLFNPTDQDQETVVTLPCLDIEIHQSFKSFEIKTLAVDQESKAVAETDLLERNLSFEE